MKRAVLGLAVGMMFVAFTVPALAKDWTSWGSPEFGFKMLVPINSASKAEGFKAYVPVAAEAKAVGTEEGWGALEMKIGLATVRAVAKLGAAVKFPVMKAFVSVLTAIPTGDWCLVDKEKSSLQDDNRGWIQSKTFKAVNGDNLVFCRMGHGPKGSYIVFLQTTVEDFKANKEDYMEWYESVTLHE